MKAEDYKAKIELYYETNPRLSHEDLPVLLTADLIYQNVPEDLPEFRKKYTHLDPDVLETRVSGEIYGYVEKQVTDNTDGVDPDATEIDGRIDWLEVLLVLDVPAARSTVGLELGTDPKLDLAVEQAVPGQAANRRDEVAPLEFDRLRLDLVDVEGPVSGVSDSLLFLQVIRWLF